MLIVFQWYKWSEKGISALFKIRRRNQMDRKYLAAPNGKILQFRRPAAILKESDVEEYLASKDSKVQEVPEKENKDV